MANHNAVYKVSNLLLEAGVKKIYGCFSNKTFLSLGSVQDKTTEMIVEYS